MSPVGAVRLVFATHNRNKVRELRQMLTLSVEVISLEDLPRVGEIAETGVTFAENAAIKAREAARITGLPSLADDSGLEVDALGGEPGVRSARYAGPDATDADRTALLLKNLEGVPAADRTARFRCAVAFVDPAAPAEVELREGSCEGVIIRAPRGGGGFGYDPVFESLSLGKTFAEAAPGEKHDVSHRGRAMAKMASFLDDWYASLPDKEP